MLEYGQRIVGHRRDALLAEAASRASARCFSGSLRAAAPRHWPSRSEASVRACAATSSNSTPTTPPSRASRHRPYSTAWIFSTASDSLVRTVIIAGQPVIRDGHHPLEARGPRAGRRGHGQRHDAGSTAPVTVVLDGAQPDGGRRGRRRPRRGAGGAGAGRDRLDARLADGCSSATAAGASASTASRRPRERSSGSVWRRPRLAISTALMLLNCRVGQGPPASREIVRGTLLRLANNLARGVTGVRARTRPSWSSRRSTRTGRSTVRDAGLGRPGRPGADVGADDPAARHARASVSRPGRAWR